MNVTEPVTRRTTAKSPALSGLPGHATARRQIGASAVPTRVRPPTVREWGAGLVVRLRLAGGGTASHYSVDDRRRGFADLPVVWTVDCGGFATRPVELLGLFRPNEIRLAGC